MPLPVTHPGHARPHLMLATWPGSKRDLPRPGTRNSWRRLQAARQHLIAKQVPFAEREAGGLNPGKGMQVHQRRLCLIVHPGRMDQLPPSTYGPLGIAAIVACGPCRCRAAATAASTLAAVSTNIRRRTSAGKTIADHADRGVPMHADELFQLPLVRPEVLAADDLLHEPIQRRVVVVKLLEVAAADSLAQGRGKDDRSARLDDRHRRHHAFDRLVEGRVQAGSRPNW